MMLPKKCNWKLILSLLVATTLLVAGQAFGGEMYRSMTGAEGPGFRNGMSLDNVIGSTVVGSDGNKLGTLVDVLFSSDGEMNYLLVSDRKDSDKLVPVPYEAAQPARFKKDATMVSLNENDFKKAPRFSKGHMRDRMGWHREVHGYYGTTDPSVRKAIRSSKEAGQRVPYPDVSKEREADIQRTLKRSKQGSYRAAEPPAERGPREPDVERSINRSDEAGARYPTKEQ